MAKEELQQDANPFIPHFLLKPCSGWERARAAPVCWINAAIWETRTAESIWVTADFGVLIESIVTLPMPSNLLGTAREKQSPDLHGHRLVISPKTLDLKARSPSFCIASGKTALLTLTCSLEELHILILLMKIN